MKYSIGTSYWLREGFDKMISSSGTLHQTWTQKKYLVSSKNKDLYMVDFDATELNKDNQIWLWE